MNVQKRLGPWAFLPGVVLLPLVAGCANRPSETKQDPEAAHISKLSTLVGKYKQAHNKAAPKNLEELKSWALKKGAAEEADFVSTRDNEPYVLAPVGGMMAMMPGQGGVVIHEKTGKDGKKFTVPPQGGMASEMTDETIETFTKGAQQRRRPS